MTSQEMPADYINELATEFDATDDAVAGRLPLAELDEIREQHDWNGQNSPADKPLTAGEIASMRELFARLGFITPVIDDIANREERNIGRRKRAA